MYRRGWKEGLQRAEPLFECEFRTCLFGVVFWFGVSVGAWVCVGPMKSILYTSRMSGWRALVWAEGRMKQAKYGAVTGSSASERPMYDLGPPYA